MTQLPDHTEVSLHCPECGPAHKLIIRTNRENGGQFLGCPRWPDCEYTREIPEDIKMNAAGAERLPGF